MAPAPRIRPAFTLIELLVAIAIIGILMALLTPAVQFARESARRIECSNNVRQQVLALQTFHGANRTFPAGRQLIPGGEYSWCVAALPYLDQDLLFRRYNTALPWNGGENWVTAQTPLQMFRCPTSQRRFPGDTDYGGITGSLLAGLQTSGVFDYENGVMIEVGNNRRSVCVSLGEITDGTSHTILVAESSDRPWEQGGLWVSGYNCFSHDNGRLNVNPGEIFSWHPGGSFVGFADGSVHFLHKETASLVIGSLCTKNGAESVADF